MDSEGRQVELDYGPGCPCRGLLQIWALGWEAAEEPYRQEWKHTTSCQGAANSQRGFPGLPLAKAKCKDSLDSGRRSRDHLTLSPSAARVRLQVQKDRSESLLPVRLV